MEYNIISWHKISLRLIFNWYNDVKIRKIDNNVKKIKGLNNDQLILNSTWQKIQIILTQFIDY